MTVGQWLGRARGVDTEIALLEEALQKARDQATRVTQSYEGDGAQSTKNPHKLDRLAEYADMIREKRDELIAVKQEIAEAIFQLPDWRMRTVAFSYFCECEKLEGIAVSMGYSYRQTKRIKNRAVETLEHVLECHPWSVV